MSKLRPVKHGDGTIYGYSFMCPGCAAHASAIGDTPRPFNSSHTVKTEAGGWGFNGSEERPTFTPSILVYEHRIPADANPTSVEAPYKPGDIYQPRCHSFVTDGRIQFLADCTHPLAGQTVDLPEIES